MTSLTETLAPKHLVDLPESDEKLREEIENQVEPSKKAVVDRANDPRNEENYTFTLSHRDGRGKLWEGTFTTKILSLAERQMVGVLRARYQGGTMLEALDASTADLNLKISHLSYSLTQYPQWAKALRDLKDPGIIDAIYAEVASHEAFFLGWIPFEGSSSEESEKRDGDS
jgi:hypothetical protein